ncbi:MAG TPA: helix-turn-helix domain-containing protein [Gammaproteobacteria bacterium]|nr:helix-turn-helix domain-containing protein [Gammaproteobacteria bacterium]
MSGDDAGEKYGDTGAEPGTDTVAQQGVAAAGQRLRSEREARGLSLTEVSTQLHLDPRLVTALEAGEDNRLPGATYITGYVRAYARLLKLDEDELAAMAGSSVAPRSELLPENVDLGRPRRGVGLAAWLVVAVLLVTAGGAGWWWFQSRPAGVVLSPAATRDALSVTDTPAAPAVMAPETTEAAAPATPGSIPGPRAATDEASSPAPPPEATPVPSSRIPLELRFTDDSWLEVTDASGAVLAYAMMEAGSQVELQGIPPFEVLLGYAPGVAITYNGQPFDSAPFIRGDVARLRIGDATP